MAAKSLQELFVEELLDMYDGEKRLTRAYEIASYGTLAHFADLLDQDRAKDLLGQTLNEEKAADQKLNEIAKSRVNRQALMGNGSTEEGETSGFRLPRPVRRAAASIGLARDESSSRRSSSRKTSGRRRSAAKRTR